MPNAYRDKDGSWHVGYGHGNAAKIWPTVTEDTKLTEPEAFNVLVADLNYLQPILNNDLKVEVNDNQYCALLDIAYNRGPGTLRRSAVMYHVNNVADPLHFKRAAHAMVFHHEDEKFTKLDTARDPATGEVRVYLGLTLRRIDDASLFLTPTQE